MLDTQLALTPSLQSVRPSVRVRGLSGSSQGTEHIPAKRLVSSDPFLKHTLRKVVFQRRCFQKRAKSKFIPQAAAWDLLQEALELKDKEKRFISGSWDEEWFGQAKNTQWKCNFSVYLLEFTLNKAQRFVFHFLLTWLLDCVRACAVTFGTRCNIRNFLEHLPMCRV